MLDLWKTEPMQAARLLDEIYALIDRLQPFDALEARHRFECLAWLRETDDVFRRVKPRTPSPHLSLTFFYATTWMEGSSWSTTSKPACGYPPAVTSSPASTR
jgi:hypothetical protein